MTKEDIIALPNPHLRQKSRRVGVITDEIRQIVKDMEEATMDWDQSRAHESGVALAAVQIDRLYKIVVVRNDYNDKDNHEFTVFINPEITKLEGEIKADFEGCLSVRGYGALVPRWQSVHVTGVDAEGRPVALQLDGWPARIMQHELDHLDGTLYIDRMQSRSFAVDTELPRLGGMPVADVQRLLGIEPGE